MNPSEKLTFPSICLYLRLFCLCLNIILMSLFINDFCSYILPCNTICNTKKYIKFLYFVTGLTIYLYHPNSAPNRPKNIPNNSLDRSDARGRSWTLPDAPGHSPMSAAYFPHSAAFSQQIQMNYTFETKIVYF